MEGEIKTNSEVKDQQPESSKFLPKKTRKDGAIMKRTKTGCKTCRRRRVKCDESRPICKNCVKSRRPCAWHDPTQAAQDQQPVFSPPSHFPHYQRRVNFTLPPPLDHTSMQYSNSFPALNPNSTMGATLQPNTFVTMSPYYDHSPDVEWPNQFDTGAQIEATSWLINQPNWMQPLTSASPFYHRGIQTSSNPELHTAAYSAYPGMPPDSNMTNWHDDVTSGSASSGAPQRESSTARTDMRKSSLRIENLGLNSATSSQLSIPPPRFSSLSRTSSYQGQAHSQDFLQFADDTGDSDDSWDESSEVNSGEDSALTNLRSAQALAIDERKAYLLRHFVNNIRPCLSISEPPLAFDGSSTWGEIIPSLALSCPGLLHGLMAASALHLAVLHGTNEMVPTKHFMIASKRLHKLLGTPSSRHQLQTLSLCLLLAWYEVMNGDHARWIMHLGGASSFLLEHIRVTSVPTGMLSTEDSRVDIDLVQHLTGSATKYASRSHAKSNNTILTDGTALDVGREWNTRLDLFWWYIKMDVFHAFLSGDPLLLPYAHWNLCPPRGRMGQRKKVHATVDYLWLVLGRLADFGARDRLRKQRQVIASGGQWRPAPGFLQPDSSMGSSKPGPSLKASQASTVPNANEGRTRAPKTGKQASNSKKGPPMNFYGMMPPPAIPPSMLSSFHVNDAELRKNVKVQRAPLKESSTSNLKDETEQALAEHAAIRDAFDAWRSALGHDFDPLATEMADSDCPFRPILSYDDPLVACMWSLYYLGRILLQRYHPHSPPAMMVSAGVNAHSTRQDAEIIGRINAGLLRNQVELAKAGSINPTLVAALQEMTFPLMFAGVQYQSAQQRLWTIDNLLDLAESAGWKSGYAIASALEAAWAAQGENGKGPPYERSLSRRSLRNGSAYERRPGASRSMYGSPESEHESRFVSHDRGLITNYADARAYWALGVLSSAEDVQQMFGQVNITND